MTQTEREKAAYPTDRRGASNKRDSDIQPSEFPLVTHAAYIACVQKPATMVDPKLRFLCKARARIGNALMAVDTALHALNPQVTNDGRDKAIYQKLRSVRDALEKQQIKFPLKIK